MSEQVVALLQRARNDQDFRTALLRAAPHELSALGMKAGQQAVLLSNLWLNRWTRSSSFRSDPCAISPWD